MTEKNINYRKDILEMFKQNNESKDTGVPAHYQKVHS